MKAWIISDIHYAPMDRFWSKSIRVPEADICICAGDVSSDLSDSLDYVLANIEPIMPVVMTLGNHEYIGLSPEQAIARAKKKAEGTSLHILENEAIEIEGVKFIGATLWTDFEIATGEGDEDFPAELRLEIARKDIKHHSLEFSAVRSDRRPGEFVDMDELRDRHLVSRAFIERELEATSYAQKSVVLTHHAPLSESLDTRFLGNLSTAAYASDLSALIRAYKPKYWVHGHIHRFRDYIFDHTRIIDNPHGLGNGERATNGFQPDFVIEL